MANSCRDILTAIVTAMPVMARQGEPRLSVKMLPRNGVFAPFVRPTPQSDPWCHDRGRIVS